VEVVIAVFREALQTGRPNFMTKKLTRNPQYEILFVEKLIAAHLVKEFPA